VDLGYNAGRVVGLKFSNGNAGESLCVARITYHFQVGSIYQSFTQ
jgi:hypothetical protein